jgi:hypothetical protein
MNNQNSLQQAISDLSEFHSICQLLQALDRDSIAADQAAFTIEWLIIDRLPKIDAAISLLRSQVATLPPGGKE